MCRHSLLVAIIMLLILHESRGISCKTTNSGGAQNAQKVLIIGAGVSGLNAGRLLKEKGIESTLFEAKANIGGRIHSEPQEGGWAFNHGANWIHGAGKNPIWKLVLCFAIVN